jgi:RNA polymerase sigma factor (sigma-70 family)
MASSLAMGGTLRHLRDLFSDGTAVGLGDGQLLARYAASRDEAAFEALVARHGPMILATCRAVLRHEHDIEDAFQATFLVLARKARSVRAADALGGWLHRVAYRAAVQVSVESRRRRRREAEASAMTTPAVTYTAPDSDIPSIVHEEVDRLPEKHRLPVVLCDLEGLTYEQAAGRLRWTVPTLRCRLARARQQLHGRLTRRGITAGTVGGVLAASAAGARAAIPAALARSAATAATGGTASVTAAVLSANVIRSMVLTKLRFAATAVLAAVALASAGFLAVGSWRPDPPTAALHPQAGAEMKRPTTAENASTRAPAPGEMIEVRGRVVDPQGRPIAGATPQAVYIGANQHIKPAPGSSGSDGRFLLRVPPPRHVFDSLSADAMRARGGIPPWIIAFAPGFGPGKAAALRKPGDSDELTIRLVDEGPPIEGRIVDLEGRPVGGARVQVERLWFARQGTLSEWLAHAAGRNPRNSWQGLDLLPTTTEIPIAATTAPDGRFRLTGIGRERIAQMLVSSPTIATAELLVLTNDGPTVSIVDQAARRAMTAPERTIYHARRFEFAAEPARSIEGVIRDQETGQPIAGIKLQGMVFQEHSRLWAPGVEATTDAQGHYRLAGLPRAAAYELSIEPGDGLPYPESARRVPADSRDPGPVSFDIALKRGILVRGRVTDKATGRPVGGYVQSHTFADNPHVREFPGYRQGRRDSPAFIKDDGRYEVVALPGRNIIACRSDEGRYRAGVGAATIKGYDPTEAGVGGFDTIGLCLVTEYNVFAEVVLDPGTESATVDLQVDPGRTLTVTAVDPEGRPIGGSKVVGLTDSFGGGEYEQDSPTFEVRALDPSRPRRVTITHAGRKLDGSIDLKGDEAGPMTVRLQPWGTITGRIVDDDGQPRGGLEVYGIRIGRDGRFRIEGLVPGRKYEASAVQGFRGIGNVFRDVTVASGEVKDLGDLKVIPPRRDN